MFSASENVLMSLIVIYCVSVFTAVASKQPLIKVLAFCLMVFVQLRFVFKLFYSLARVGHEQKFYSKIIRKRFIKHNHTVDKFSCRNIAGAKIVRFKMDSNHFWNSAPKSIIPYFKLKKIFKTKLLNTFI